MTTFKTSLMPVCRRLTDACKMWLITLLMMKANPGIFQIIFLCPPKYIERFHDIFAVSDIGPRD